jgi:hypothetical protein
MKTIHPILKPQESTMKLLSSRTLFAIVMALSLSSLAACADVRQAPAGAVVDGQSAQPTAQVADVAPVRQSSVPF